MYPCTEEELPPDTSPSPYEAAAISAEEDALADTVPMFRVVPPSTDVALEIEIVVPWSRQP